MNNLDKYIKEKKIELEQKNITDELEIIKYIYIDLGNRLSFDHNFIPFGNSKSREKIYKYNSRNIVDLDKCMNKNTAICKSLSYILEYVLKDFDVDIKAITDPIDNTKYPHVFNLIHLKDGRKFCIDLQEDINNIQTHSFTNNFGLESIYSPVLLINKEEQEKIDRKIGYISDNSYYADDYLYLLHTIADGIDNIFEKAKFILENIDLNSTEKMGYIDRQWHHKKVLEEFFNEKEFEYEHNSGKIRIYDCYKEINGEKRYISFVTVTEKKKTEIYVYNEKESKYSEIDIEHWFNCINNGVQVNGKLVRGVRKHSNNNKIMVK